MSRNLPKTIFDDSLLATVNFARKSGAWLVEGAAPAARVQPPAQTAPSDLPILSMPSGGELSAIREEIGECTRCRLHSARTHIVFGVGNPHASLMFVGEGPGETEDLMAEPFVGRAGKLLDKMIEAMGLRRADVYIANVVKCRPPQNRDPKEDEIATCSPFLWQQIEAVNPKVVCSLGAHSAHVLSGTDSPIGKLRGKALKARGRDFVATYHPAYLLRNPAAKRQAWQDLKFVKSLLGM